MDSYQHVNFGNQDQGQNQEPNQFGNWQGSSPEETAEEESSVKETIQGINRKNIIKSIVNLLPDFNRSHHCWKAPLRRSSKALAIKEAR